MLTVVKMQAGVLAWCCDEGQVWVPSTSTSTSTSSQDANWGEHAIIFTIHNSALTASLSTVRSLSSDGAGYMKLTKNRIIS